MARESVAEKGRRYLIEGRLTVTRVTGAQRRDRHLIEATCRGTGELYRLGWDGREWYCECPARRLCCHLVALMLVTVRPEAVEGWERERGG